MGAVEQGHGLEVLQWITARVEAPSDQAAAKVAEWLTEPPVVSEAKKWMLSSVLAQWRAQLKRAADLGAALTAVQQRLSLAEGDCQTARGSAGVVDGEVKGEACGSSSG